LKDGFLLQEEHFEWMKRFAVRRCEDEGVKRKRRKKCSL